MKKIGCVLLLVVVLLLTGCCRHQWTDPTCVELSTCTVCGETRGKLLAHSWAIATQEAPKHCIVCGETRGQSLSAQQLVKTAYEDALQQAKNKNREPTFAILELRDEILPVIDSLSVGVNAENALRALVPDSVVGADARGHLMDMITYVEDVELRRLGAVMLRLSTLESVAGTVEPFEAHITVESTDRLLQEMQIRPKVLGRLLTALSPEATEDLGKLEFTETGFTFSWVSDGTWALDLDPTPMPVTEADLVFYQTAISSDERYRDLLKDLREKCGEEPGFVAVYEYLGYEYAGQVRTARGVSIGSPRELVLELYGEAELRPAGEDCTLYRTMFPNGAGDETQREDFLWQSRTWVEYPVTEKLSLSFTFDETDHVAWLIVLQK